MPKEVGVDVRVRNRVRVGGRIRLDYVELWALSRVLNEMAVRVTVRVRARGRSRSVLNKVHAKFQP